jgi:hypothetical protein
VMSEMHMPWFMAERCMPFCLGVGHWKWLACCVAHESCTAWGRHPILLANDHMKTAYRFRHVRDVNNPDNGRPLGEFVLED